MKQSTNILAIYAGTFYPIHIGHLNIIEKIEYIFGKENVLIAIGYNPSKQASDLVFEKPEDVLKRIGRKAEKYSTFLHDFIKEKEDSGYNVVLIRGLRNGDDLSYENNQLSYIHDYKKDVKSVFIMCDKEYEHISSSSIKQLEQFSTGSACRYLI